MFWSLGGTDFRGCWPFSVRAVMDFMRSAFWLTMDL